MDVRRDQPHEGDSGHKTQRTAGREASAKIEPAHADTPMEKEDLPTYHKKRGRQRTNDLICDLITYRIVRGYWPAGLSDDMCIYYNQHYIRKSGKFHDKAVQWRREAAEKFGKKFGITEKIRAPRLTKSSV